MYKYILPSVANHICTPSDRKGTPEIHVPRLGTPGIVEQEILRVVVSLAMHFVAS